MVQGLRGNQASPGATLLLLRIVRVYLRLICPVASEMPGFLLGHVWELRCAAAEAPQ